MPNSILEEHGLFWWSDEPVPDTQFAPEASVAGTLRINDEGRILLELDGVLPHKHGPFAVFSEAGKQLDKGICGKLKESSRYVRLFQVRRNGGSFKSAGISFEKYFSFHALVGGDVPQPEENPLVFWKLQVDLKGFEEWLMMRSIETNRTRSTIRVKYRGPKTIKYPIDEGLLSIAYDISGPFPGKSHAHDITLKELALLEYMPREGVSLECMKVQYGLWSDLFILLTGSDYHLDWPRLVRRAGRNKIAYQFYFLRHRTTAEPPKLHECWTNFPSIKDHFGAIFSTFRKKRERFGPGIYLYLGFRRARQMYEEHRFVNLIWGLESFHRRREGEPDEISKLRDKIERILRGVQRASDRKWLRGQLSHAAEPSLAERMFEMFKEIPFGLEERALRIFCKECADRRNDISHFGGQRHNSDYEKFMLDISRRSEALSYLYHAFLLQEIGVDSEILQWNLNKGLRSFAIKSAFVEVGLLPRSVLRS